MKPCNTCGQVLPLSRFYTDNGLSDKKRNICKVCSKASAKEWKDKNKKRVATYNKNYEFYLRDKERKSYLQKKRYSTPKGRSQLFKNRKIRKKRFRNNLSYKLRLRDIKKMYNQPCWNCGSDKDQTIDHRIPISRGGSHGIGNMMTLCKACNLSKYNSTIMEWKMSGRAYQRRQDQEMISIFEPESVTWPESVK